MNGIELFPVTAAMLYTMVGSILFAGLATQWLKKFLDDWRYTSLLCLGLAVGVEFAAAWISQKGMTAEIGFAAFLLGVLGASVATFGYEVITNLLGLIGAGPRSDAALVKTAVKELSAASKEALSADEELERALAVVEAAGIKVVEK